MKTFLFFPLLLMLVSDTPGQTFSGTWKGTVTRDFGNQVITDSILLELYQQENKITGYSVLYVKPGVFIRSILEGTYLSVSKTLRLTETKIQSTNVLRDDDDFFLDRYLLNYDEADQFILTGTSIPCNRKAVYSRSKMMLKKMPEKTL